MCRISFINIIKSSPFRTRFYLSCFFNVRSGWYMPNKFQTLDLQHITILIQSSTYLIKYGLYYYELWYNFHELLKPENAKHKFNIISANKYPVTLNEKYDNHELLQHHYLVENIRNQNITFCIL